jgi:UDP-N-acetylmuramoyl-L-alanyl-D-glutamate--2,6-diaminopimelate ligase
MIADSAGLTLAELVRELPLRAWVEGDPAVRVRGVQQDSRRIEAGDLFVARAGAHADGARFVSEARARGAVAVLCDAGALVPDGVPAVRVEDILRALAFAAAAIYGHPSFIMEVLGVTGTNGKTTTTHLVRAAVDGALGMSRCGIIGTVGHQYAELHVPASHTTPEADELSRILAAMRDRGASHVAMEVSSIALSTHRVRAVRFRVAAFTNLTQDHLDFHDSMESYAAAKADLFTQHSPGSAVINVSDHFGRELASKVRAPLVRVSTQVLGEVPADIAPTSLTLSERGIEAFLRTPQGEIALVSRLIGMHNVENLVVALGVVHALGLDLRRASEALANESGPPGRLERCEEPGDDVIVLVDYAHTPDALGRALDAVRPITRGRVFCVFGCGGDRDKTKRGPIGRAAGERADILVVTNDNPRSEAPEAIADAIVHGIREVQLTALPASALRDATRGYLVELDRAQAIHAVVMSARPGDLVLIAGKGHESYQIQGDDRRPFADRAHARAALVDRRRSLARAG